MSRPTQVASTPIPASNVQMLESSLASLLTEGSEPWRSACPVARSLASAYRDARLAVKGASTKGT